MTGAFFLSHHMPDAQDKVTRKASLHTLSLTTCTMLAHACFFKNITVLQGMYAVMIII